MELSARDLAEGMRGDSGMVDYDLFDAYHDCMDASVRESLRRLPLCDVMSHVHRVASAAARAAKKLESIPCSFTLRQARTFKVNLLFSMYNLPFVRRSALRQILLDGNSQQFTGKRASTCDFNLESLRQCLTILDRKRNYTFWEDVVGSEHFGDEAEIRSSKHLQLCSENHWIWAFSLSLESLESFWDESLISIQTADIQAKTDKSAGMYMLARRDELVLVWKSVTPLLMHEPEESARAASLPSPIKLRLVALLDRMVAVQLAALRTVMLCIQQDAKGARLRFLDMIESFSCILSWLDTPSSTDIIAAAADWYAVEKEYKPKTRAALARVEKLRASLHRLERIVGSAKGQTVPVVFELERKMSSCHGCNEVEEEEDDDDIAYIDERQLHRAIQAKLECFEADQQKFSASEKAQLKARAAEITKRARQERNKKTLRSRNKAIDALYEDDKILNEFFIRKSGRGDSFDDDPYADLEDFVVDG